MVYKLWYVRKHEATIFIWLWNHGKDEIGTDGITASKHSNCSRHNFQLLAKFALREKINKLNIDKEKLKKPRKKTTFWIIKLDTPHPKVLNDRS